MNKSLPIIAVVLLLIIGGGAYLTFKNKPVQPGAVNTNINQGQPQDGNVFTSIKDALSKSLSLECKYNDEKGTESTTHIKGGAVHVAAKTLADGKETNTQVIMKDRKMYTWDEATKKGVVFDIPEENLQTTPSTQAPSGDNKGDSFLAEIEKYKDACKPAVVSDSLFTPPTDVEFQDFSKMFQNPPTGTMQDNSVPSEFDLEELIRQYSPEGQ